MKKNRSIDFFGLPCDAKEAEFSVLPVGYDKTASYAKGTNEGPAKILEASNQIDFYDLELRSDVTKWLKVETLADVGSNKLDAERMNDKVYETVRGILSRGKTPVMLGGEHSISFGAVKAVQERYPKLSVLHIDAHFDFRDEYEGSRYNHACVMRRVSELGIKPVQAGIRSGCPEEVEFSRKLGNTVFYENNYSLDHILGGLGEEVYISFDIDGIDPSIVPGTGTPEPGGLDWFQALEIVRETCKAKNVVGFDCVEVAPIPHENRSEFIAAKLVYKMMAYTHFKRAGLW